MALTGCGGDAATDNKPADRPGSAVVYQRIASLSDCSALQEEFDIADAHAESKQDAGLTANVELSYMAAANDRMREIGCYG